jgi:hypothetical protein
MHQAPVIGLGRAHRDAGREHDLADLELVAQQPVVELHHVVIAVDGELAAEAVGRLGCAPQPERVDKDHVEPVGVEQQIRADQRAAREAVARLSGYQLLYIAVGSPE